MSRKQTNLFCTLIFHVCRRKYFLGTLSCSFYTLSYSPYYSPISDSLLMIQLCFGFSVCVNFFSKWHNKCGASIVHDTINMVYFRKRRKQEVDVENMTVNIVIGPMLINHSLKTCLVYGPILAIYMITHLQTGLPARWSLARHAHLEN